MRFRRVIGALAMLGSLAVPAAISVAQRPADAATTAFDGRYVGTATPTGGGQALGYCWPVKSIDMTIAKAQEIIHGILFTGLELTYHGKANAAGEVSAFRRPVDAAIMSGTIHDKVYRPAHKGPYLLFHGPNG